MSMHRQCFFYTRLTRYFNDSAFLKVYILADSTTRKKHEKSPHITVSILRLAKYNDEKVYNIDAFSYTQCSEYFLRFFTYIRSIRKTDFFKKEQTFKTHILNRGSISSTSKVTFRIVRGEQEVKLGRRWFPMITPHKVYVTIMLYLTIGSTRRYLR